MLSSLKIKNIALISGATIEFDDRLNILSGETGAGKSLIIDSLNFVLGARADKTLIKSGEEFAFVEAVFFVPHLTADIEEFFHSINEQADGNIIISRYLNLNGRTDIKVNGAAVTNAMLRKLTSQLVDIHGQHSHQALLEVKNHLEILDAFNAQVTGDLLGGLVGLLNSLKVTDAKIAAIGGAGADRERGIELLKYQINEITLANLKPHEEEELASKKTLMLNAEKVGTALSEASRALLKSDVTALSLIKSALSGLSATASIDSQLHENFAKLQNLYYELQDVAEALSDKEEEIFYDENELNRLEERLDLIKGLKRKYGFTLEVVGEHLNSLLEKLDLLVNAEKTLDNLMRERSVILKDIFAHCKLLTNVRKEIALSVREQIILHLKDLGIKTPNFEVVFKGDYTLESFEKMLTNSGCDDVEFMFSANLGEPLKPLSKIISGGEMSRFMLAIKCVLNENSNKTFIFDEIDNGIGGTTGTVVAEKLSVISKQNQIICVTHLAQIASFASTHFYISKVEDAGKTKTLITKLGTEERVSEVSRLLGSSGSEVGLLHAKEMLEKSLKKSNS